MSLSHFGVQDGYHVCQHHIGPEGTALPKVAASRLGATGGAVVDTAPFDHIGVGELGVGGNELRDGAGFVGVEPKVRLGEEYVGTLATYRA